MTWAEVDRGSCGQCIFFELDGRRGQNSWAACRNEKIPVHFTKASWSPRHALRVAAAPYTLEALMKINGTCLQKVRTQT